MELPIQKDVLRFQVMVQQRRGHVMEEVYAEGDLVENTQPQRPGQRRVQVFLLRGQRE